MSSTDPGVPAASDRYAGDRGARYYESFQRASAQRGAPLLVPRFAAHVRPGDRVVDFGCGGGWLLELLDAGVKVGIEVGDAARRDAQERGLDVRAALTDVEDGFADVVISNHALEHVLDPFAQLCEMHRVLRPGGRLVVVVPIGDWRGERRIRRDDLHGHLFSWTPQNMYNVLVEAGFVDVVPEVSTFAWPPRVDLWARVSPLYQVAGRVWSVLRRRRELVTTARRAAT